MGAYSPQLLAPLEYSTVTGEEDGVRGWLTPYSTLCGVKEEEKDQLGFGALIQPTYQIDHDYFCYYIVEY